MKAACSEAIEFAIAKISSAVMDPAFMGSDLKVSSGMAPEDVADTADDATVHRVLEQEEWGMLVTEAVPELERETEKVAVDFEAGSWVLMRGVTCETDIDEAILLVGGGTCELAGSEFLGDVIGRGTAVGVDGSEWSGTEALVLDGSADLSVFGGSDRISVFGGGASVLGLSVDFSVFGGSTGLVVLFPPLFAAAST